MADNALGLNDLVRIVRRHSGKVVLTFMAVFLVSLAVLYFLPRKYESEAMLFVRVGRESVTLDPTVTTGQTMTLNESRESELNSILEVIRSRALMEQVVDRLGPAAVLHPPVEQGSTAESSLLEGLTNIVGQAASLLEPGRAISEREKAVQLLANTAHISNAYKSNIISITYKAKTPEQAQAIVQAIADEYLLEHSRINRTPGSYDFFLEQEQKVSKQLQSSLDAYRATKDKMGIASIEGKRTLVESHVQKLSTEKLAATTALSTSKAKLASLEESIASLPDHIDLQQVQGMPNVAGDNMRQTLFQLEIKQRELMSRYTADHPEVKAVAEAVEGAKRIMQAQADSRIHSTTAANPTLQKLEQDLMIERSTAESLEAQQDTLAQQLGLAMEDLREVNKQEQDISLLQHDLALAETNYAEYGHKLEEARIQQSLDNEQFRNVTISQAASFVEKPASPKKSIFLAGSFLFASLCGLLAAVRAECKHTQIDNKEDAEKALGVPVMVTVPKVSEERVLVEH